MTALPVRRPVPEGAPETRPGLRVVALPDARARAVLWLVAALLIAATAIVATVALNAMAADHAVVADRVEARLQAAEVRHGELVIEVAALESPARITAAAQDLGLVRVHNPRQLHVERLLPADGIVHDDDVVLRDGDALKPLLAKD